MVVKREKILLTRPARARFKVNQLKKKYIFKEWLCQSLLGLEEESQPLSKLFLSGETVVVACLPPGCAPSYCFIPHQNPTKRGSETLLKLADQPAKGCKSGREETFLIQLEIVVK